jgi:hypothetical protein
MPLNETIPVKLKPIEGGTSKAIQRLLNINEEDYTAMLFDCAFAFANHFYRVKVAVDQIIKTSAYWNWYRNQFEQADILFIHRFRDSGSTKKALRELWKEEHAAYKLEAFPGKEVVYEAMMGVYDAGVKAGKLK